MDDNRSKTTLIFIVRTFCLTGNASGNASALHRSPLDAKGPDMARRISAAEQISLLDASP